MPGISLSLDVSGLTPLIDRLGAAPEYMTAQMQLAARDSVLIMEANVKERTPVVTGRLISSEQSEISGGGGEVLGRVFTNVFYAPYVEMGRGPVTARGRALGVWPTGIPGIGWRKRVGPAAGRHMFQEGLRASLRGIRDAFRDAAKRVAGFIAG